jgi:hypothetical protein
MKSRHLGPDQYLKSDNFSPDAAAQRKNYHYRSVRLTFNPFRIDLDTRSQKIRETPRRGQATYAEIRSGKPGYADKT